MKHGNFKIAQSFSSLQTACT